MPASRGEAGTVDNHLRVLEWWRSIPLQQVVRLSMTNSVEPYPNACRPLSKTLDGQVFGPSPSVKQLPRLPEPPTRVVFQTIPTSMSALT